MMRIPIYNSYPLETYLFNSKLGCNGYVIEEREAMWLIFQATVMSWRSNYSKCVLIELIGDGLQCQKCSFDCS